MLDNASTSARATAPGARRPSPATLVLVEPGGPDRVWHRRLLRRPDVNGWWIWQVGGFSRVAGISTDVDLNVMRGTTPPR